MCLTGRSRGFPAAVRGGPVCGLRSSPASLDVVGVGEELWLTGGTGRVHRRHRPGIRWPRGGFRLRRGRTWLEESWLADGTGRAHRRHRPRGRSSPSLRAYVASSRISFSAADAGHRGGVALSRSRCDLLPGGEPRAHGGGRGGAPIGKVRMSPSFFFRCLEVQQL